MIIPEKFGKVDVLAKQESATIDVGVIENPGAFRNYLESKGYTIIEERESIWTVKRLQTNHGWEPHR